MGGVFGYEKIIIAKMIRAMDGVSGAMKYRKMKTGLFGFMII